ncbi:MAG: hypothetical protein Q9171_002914 [Xanthocarpia ochracea]
MCTDQGWGVKWQLINRIGSDTILKADSEVEANALLSRCTDLVSKLATHKMTVEEIITIMVLNQLPSQFDTIRETKRNEADSVPKLHTIVEVIKDNMRNRRQLSVVANFMGQEEKGKGKENEKGGDKGDRDNPFYPSIVDEESVTSVSEPPNTLRDRLSRVVRWPLKTPKSVYQFTGDAEKDQLIKSLDQYTVGYPKVAAFENADPSFLIYRKFGWLHNRLLLYLQDELAELEHKLDQLDKATFSDDEDFKLSSRRDDWIGPSKRRDLVRQIAQKLEEYDKHLLRYQKVQAIRRPTIRNQVSLYNFIQNTQSLIEPEYRWIREGIDLAAIARGQEHGWFASFLLNRLSRKARQFVFRTKEQKIVTGHEDISLVDPYRLDIFLRVVLAILAAILLLVPVLILCADEVRRKGKYQVLIIFLFTIVFSVLCSLFTKARRQEVFTATAVYCAVLVVFLGNIE